MCIAGAVLPSGVQQGWPDVLATIAAVASAVAAITAVCVARRAVRESTANRRYLELREALNALTVFGHAYTRTAQLYGTLPTDAQNLSTGDPEGHKRAAMKADARRHHDALNDAWSSFDVAASAIMTLYPDFASHREQLNAHYDRLDKAMNDLGGGFLASKRGDERGGPAQLLDEDLRCTRERLMRMMRDPLARTSRLSRLRTFLSFRRRA